MITNQLKKQLEEKGISEEVFNRQLQVFRFGVEAIELNDAARIDNGGIIKLTKDEENNYLSLYESEASELSMLKFVPASGAASRMFKDLYAFLESGEETDSTLLLKQNIEKFAFYSELKNTCKSNNFKALVHNLLNEEGLNYGKLPKALLKFHTYGEKVRTSFEEHLVEGALYAKGKGGIVDLHFTASSEHLAYFNSLFDEVRDFYESEFNCKFNVSYSIQKESTDTLAVDLQNEPFLDEYGQVLFRPGGHGALIENLNEQRADLIFIKNIDNVVPDYLKEQTVRSKKILAGALLYLQKKIKNFTNLLKKGSASDSELINIKHFIETNLGYRFSVSKMPEHSELLSILERPLRICGMVKNEGEPGGGPFWINDKKGGISLQIIERSQVDLNNLHQNAIFEESTHFNPVDIVCSTRNCV